MAVQTSKPSSRRETRTYSVKRLSNLVNEEFTHFSLRKLGKKTRVGSHSIPGYDPYDTDEGECRGEYERKFAIVSKRDRATIGRVVVKSEDACLGEEPSGYSIKIDFEVQNPCLLEGRAIILSRCKNLPVCRDAAYKWLVEDLTVMDRTIDTYVEGNRFTVRHSTRKKWDAIHSDKE